MKVQFLPDDYFLGKYRFTPFYPNKIDSRTGALQIYVGSNGPFTFDKIVRNILYLFAGNVEYLGTYLLLATEFKSQLELSI